MYFWCDVKLKLNFKLNDDGGAILTKNVTNWHAMSKVLKRRFQNITILPENIGQP